MRSRQQIIDATVDVIVTDGFAAVTVATVADLAGVSRQTVYSIFGSRENLVSQVVGQVAVQTLQDVQAKVGTASTAAGYVVELLIGVRAAAREHPVLSALLRSDVRHPLFEEDMMTRALTLGRDFMLPVLEHEPRLYPHLDQLAEVFTRLGSSLVLFDSDLVGDENTLRALLEQVFGPILDAWATRG
jgi:AcrR family transcriptional regulator